MKQSGYLKRQADVQDRLLKIGAETYQPRLARKESASCWKDWPNTRTRGWHPRTFLRRTKWRKFIASSKKTRHIGQWGFGLTD